MYYGNVAAAQAYFEGLGFEFPPQQNPADLLMDATSGVVLREGQVGRPGWRAGSAGGQQHPAVQLCYGRGSALNCTPAAPSLPLQASAAELADEWEAHCGRPRKTPRQLAAIASGEQLDAADAQARAQPGSGPARGGADGAAACAEADQGEGDESGDEAELLGDAKQRRSWRRRLRCGPCVRAAG